MKNKEILTQEILKKKDWQILTAGLLTELVAFSQVIMDQNAQIISKLYNISLEDASKQKSELVKISRSTVEKQILDPDKWPDYDHTKKEE